MILHPFNLQIKNPIYYNKYPLFKYEVTIKATPSICLYPLNVKLSYDYKFYLTLEDDGL